VLLVSVSCRVLALEPATVFLATALRASCGGGGVHGGVGAEARGPIVAGLAATERNTPCQNVFRDAGFTRARTPGDVGRGAGGGPPVGEGPCCPGAVLQDGQQESQWVLDDLQKLPTTDPDIYTVSVKGLRIKAAGIY
jgi:hypothetical protein